MLNSEMKKTYAYMVKCGIWPFTKSKKQQEEEFQKRLPNTDALSSEDEIVPDIEGNVLGPGDYTHKANEKRRSEWVNGKKPSVPPVTHFDPKPGLRPNTGPMVRKIMNSPEYNTPRLDFEDPRVSKMYDYRAADPARFQREWDNYIRNQMARSYTRENTVDWMSAPFFASRYPERNMYAGIPASIGPWLFGGEMGPLGIGFTSAAGGYAQAAVADWNRRNAFEEAKKRIQLSQTNTPGANPYEQAANGYVGFIPSWGEAIVGAPVSALYSYGAGSSRRNKLYTESRAAELKRLEEEANKTYPDEGSGKNLKSKAADRAKYITDGLAKFDAPYTFKFRNKTFEIPRLHRTFGPTGPLVRDLGLGWIGSYFGNQLYHQRKHNNDVNLWEQWERENMPGTPGKPGQFTPMNTTGYVPLETERDSSSSSESSEQVVH